MSIDSRSYEPVTEHAFIQNDRFYVKSGILLELHEELCGLHFCPGP
jgi:hypothetical protein